MNNLYTNELMIKRITMGTLGYSNNGNYYPASYNGPYTNQLAECMQRFPEVLWIIEKDNNNDRQ